MKIIMNISPPTATAQMKKIRVVNGRPFFYEPPAVKNAKKTLMANLEIDRPSAPLEGAISLYVLWLFPRGKTHKDGEWRITRPDTDNLQKLLKDCITASGYWRDDSQVAQEIVEKLWSDKPGIYINIEQMEVKKNDGSPRTY